MDCKTSYAAFGMAGFVSLFSKKHPALPQDHIVQADYRVVSDVRCIYAETAEDTWGYTQRYWVSVDTGLLVVAERLQKGETVYRMAALEADQTAPPAETFTLPDGTDLLHR